MEGLLREFTRRGIEVKFVPLHLSSGGIGYYQGQYYCAISLFDSIRQKQFTLSYLLVKMLELGYYTKKAASVSLVTFGSLLRL